MSYRFCEKEPAVGIQSATGTVVPTGCKWDFQGSNSKETLRSGFGTPAASHWLLPAFVCDSKHYIGQMSIQLGRDR